MRMYHCKTLVLNVDETEYLRRERWIDIDEILFIIAFEDHGDVTLRGGHKITVTLAEMREIAELLPVAQPLQK